MAVRPTMQDLIDLLRAKGNASTDDLFGGVTYWTDEQLQEILDETAEFVTIELEAKDTDCTIYSLETLSYKKLEEGYEVYNENNELLDTSNTYDLNKNYITFDAESTADYVQGWRYDLYDAIAELYDRKASHREFYTRMKAGNTTLHLDQEYKQCIARRNYYLNKKIRRLDRGRNTRWRT